jgi:hypothetical protein
MVEFEYTTGPRILEDGTNLDADFSGSHPKVLRREITDSVSDGSLGEPGYEPGQLNKDGTPL